MFSVLGQIVENYMKDMRNRRKREYKERKEKLDGWTIRKKIRGKTSIENRKGRAVRISRMSVWLKGAEKRVRGKEQQWTSIRQREIVKERGERGKKVLGKGKRGLPGWVVDRRLTRQLLVINRVTSNTLKLRRISFCFRRRNNLPSPSVYSEFKDIWWA